ncbi:MAG TPA: hypothetical protein DCW86_03760 [Actinobacteria bacterium]|nr:hypothetical protein [Actinomycetota bacterium]
MIVGEQKPVDEIREMIADYEKILVLGCNGCVAVCFAGGEREVKILASALRMTAKIAGDKKEITEGAVEKQCEWEFIESLKEQVEKCEAVVSIACGIGVQALAEKFPETPIFPGLNTSFMGMPLEAGVWAETCAACGECILDKTGGICPIARCAKNLLNGPCGGSQDGKCEVSPETPCAWELIYHRFKDRGRLGALEEIRPAKDWSKARDGGVRKIVREDLKL